MVTIDKEISVPFYVQLKEQLKEMILSGVLKKDTRLPPTRQLAEELEINRNTVLTAYEELEADGLVYSHVGRGTFVENLSGLIPNGQPQQATRFYWPNHLSANIDDFMLNSLVQLHRFGTSQVKVSFGGGFPPTELYPIQLISRAFHAVVHQDGVGAFGYGPVEGLPQLQDLIARRMKGMGVDADPGEVFITSGSQQALAIAARALIDSGDTILVEEPTYTGAISVFKTLRAKMVGIPVDRDGLNLTILEEMCRKHNPKLLYTIPNFHNPTGRIMSIAQRRQLIRLAEKYSLPIIEDDVFGELRYEGENLPPLKAFDRSGQVIYIDSMSKKLLPGFRLGWAVAHPEVLKRFVAFKTVEDLGTNSLAQAILVKFCSRGYLKTHLRRVRKSYRQRRDVMLQSIKDHFPADVTVHCPLGGLFIWVTFPEKTDLTPAWEVALKKGIMFCLGNIFYISGKGKNEMRLSFTTHCPEIIKEGIRTLGEILSANIGKQKKALAEVGKLPMV